MEREEGERVNWCYSTFHHHHHQQQQQQSHRIARILHSVTFRLQSRYGGHYVCAVVCLFVCLFVLFCFRGSSATEHCGDLRFQYCNIFCVCVCVRACVCASGGDETERRGKLREMEMFWREIFREVCTHDYAHTVTSTCDTHGHVARWTQTTLHRALLWSVLCRGKLRLNDSNSSSLLRRVPPECVFWIFSANSAFSQHKPKHIFGFLPDTLFVANCTWKWHYEIYLTRKTHPNCPKTGKCVVHSGTVWSTVALSGLQWHCLVYSGTVWTTVALSGLQWQCLVPSSTLWSAVALSGLQWHCLVRSGTVWSTVALSSSSFRHTSLWRHAALATDSVVE